MLFPILVAEIGNDPRYETIGFDNSVVLLKIVLMLKHSVGKKIVEIFNAARLNTLAFNKANIYIYQTDEVVDDRIAHPFVALVGRNRFDTGELRLNFLCLMYGDAVWCLQTVQEAVVVCRRIPQELYGPEKAAEVVLGLIL